MKGRPPIAIKQSIEVEKFIAGAGVNPGETPWSNARADVKKIFNLRLPEAEFLKLKLIQDKTNKSMHKFCVEALLPAIEKEIAKILDGAI